MSDNKSSTSKAGDDDGEILECHSKYYAETNTATRSYYNNNSDTVGGATTAISIQTARIE